MQSVWGDFVVDFSFDPSIFGFETGALSTPNLTKKVTVRVRQRSGEFPPD